MNRYYYSDSIQEFIRNDDSKILGELTKHHFFTLEEAQKSAWLTQISILKNQLRQITNGYLYFEFSIPRMGKRVDNIIIYKDIIYVIEFKIGEKKYDRSSIDQVMDYTLELKNFHEGSHQVKLVPVLIATEANEIKIDTKSYDDKIYAVQQINRSNLYNLINSFQYQLDAIDYKEWEKSKYKPTPTIIEAAQALYRGHNVEEISRSDAGAINIGLTALSISQIIEDSKNKNVKSICFVTGVPGSGKTLAGLNLANERHKCNQEEHAVFLSGNGPLVEVLQEALARNQKENNSEQITKRAAKKNASTFIQNIHHFRDEAIFNNSAPFEKIVIFDEAQRAWTKEQTTSFMLKKKGVPAFNQSEPEFLISIMDRHPDWAVIICLIGGGQEINTGEAGIIEWFNALVKRHKKWKVFLSKRITDYEYIHGNSIEKLLQGVDFNFKENLHLAVSLRSFRSEKVSEFIKYVLDNEIKLANEVYRSLKNSYPLFLTRDYEKAKIWLKTKQRGNERIGILASSGAYRLKPFGIYVQLKIDAPSWFLNPKFDIRSSCFLEEVATEFDVQGLELDWACVAWDADLRYCNNKWTYKKFKGTDWQNINDSERCLYLKNAYRVLLTRARQGMIIFIPQGNNSDYTRLCEYYDQTYKYFKNIGISEL